MAQLEVKQVKSSIGCKQDQIATLKALGLKKIRDVKYTMTMQQSAA